MRIRILTIAMAAVALSNIAAHAHAFLDHASPLVGSTVASAPRELALTFTQNLEAAFSSVQVTDTNGGRVDSGKPQISGNTMRVGLSLCRRAPTACAGMCFLSIPIRRKEASPSASAVHSFGRSAGLRACRAFRRDNHRGGRGDF
jgi:hypothetical protein